MAEPYVIADPARAPGATYHELSRVLGALIAGERDWLANSANFASLLFHGLTEINWAGFYWLRGEGLVVGAFQGKPACVRIPLGRGVCGTAAAERRTVLVTDVEDFAGHIACDADSRAEIVVPLHRAGRLLGVLDLDSPRPGRFTAEDAAGLEALVGQLVLGSDWPA